MSMTMSAQGNGKNTILVNQAQKTLQTMIVKTPSLESLYNNSFGYVVYPKIKRTSIGIGKAIGKGVVFKNHLVQGELNLNRTSIGLQFGGEQYSKIVFFKNKESFEKFINKKLNFERQYSKIRFNKDKSTNLNYHEGVTIYTSKKFGFMYEGSIAWMSILIIK